MSSSFLENKKYCTIFYFSKCLSVNNLLSKMVFVRFWVNTFMLSISSSSIFFVLFYLFYFLIDLFNFLFFIYFYFLTNETHFYLEKWKSNFKIISRWKNSLSYLVPFSKPSPRNKKNCPPPLSPPQKKIIIIKKKSWYFRK